ncbi:MAG: sensor histidine kinase [Adhaeribacter sp.]|jgi:two-component system NarL family sensor kinase|nr:sensor histidine kinase [Adhaeribacter sp.]
MQTLADEIYIVIGITLLMLLVTSFVVVFIFIHRHQFNKHLQEKEEIKNAYQQEILKAQLEMKEQTLHTISQEIHDNIGQVLSLAKLNLNTILLSDDNPAASKITTTKELVAKAIQDLRNLSKSLNTDHISQKKLSESLKFELDQIQKTGMYKTDLKIEGSEQPFDPQKQLIIFRIVQEALQNIMKHAKAQYIFINLNYLPDKLIMSIKDDGSGFDMAAINQADKGTGIANMYHRARLMGAEIRIESQLGKGTLTQLWLPTRL